jgi:hypothetical protein
MGRKVCFFEKKQQKTFGRLASSFPGARLISQKFFGSFFQKRTTSFATSLELS